MFSRLESHRIAHMPTLLPVLPFQFEHTVALHLTSLLMRMRLVVVHHMVASVVVQLLSRMRMHLQRVLSLGFYCTEPVPVLTSDFLSAAQNTFAVRVPTFSRSSCLSEKSTDAADICRFRHVDNGFDLVLIWADSRLIDGLSQ